MKQNLFDNTKVAAYYLWEYTKHENALDLWHCAEDIAYYFEREDIISISRLKSILQGSRFFFPYIDFVRNIAYRMYVCTNIADPYRNWYMAEKLLDNQEWVKAVIEVARIYRKIREGDDEAKSCIRSSWIRKYLG